MNHEGAGKNEDSPQSELWPLREPHSLTTYKHVEVENMFQKK